MPDQWTAERVTLLKILWASGASASAIAARLGLSRSAVLGKIYRLQQRAAEPSEAPQRPPPRLQKDEPATRENGKGLLELTNNCCRWPIGRGSESEIFFCGVPEADLARGMPYCPHHARRGYVIPPAAYLTPSTRRRSVWRAGVRHPAPRFR